MQCGTLRGSRHKCWGQFCSCMSMSVCVRIEGFRRQYDSEVTREPPTHTCREEGRGKKAIVEAGKKGGRRVLNVPIAGRDAVGDSWRSSSRSETSNTLVTVAAVFIGEALAREKFELGFGLGFGFGFGFGLRCRRCKAFSGHILDHIAFSLRACTCDEMSVMKA